MCESHVSTQEQELNGYSVDNQIDALKEYCISQGYVIVDVYNDAGISARKAYTYRPELLRMLADCADKKIDLILFTKLDRWFRSVSDYYQVQNILDKHKVPWKAIWEDYETVTSAGVFKVNIMLSIAQAEADRTGERIKAVNEYRRANGQITYGKAPTGYKSVKSALVIDEEKRDAVRAGFESYMMSGSVVEMQKTMSKKGVTIARETCTRMLKNPTYSGDAYGIPCEPYLTLEEWDLICRSIERRQTRRSTLPKRTYLFNGLLRCGACGYGYHSQNRGMKSGGKYYYQKYYSCGRGRNMLCENRTSITELKIEKYLVRNIDEMLKMALISADTDSVEEIDTESIKAKIKAKIKRIGDRYEEGEITKEEYREKVGSLNAELKSLGENKKRVLKPLSDHWQDIYWELDDLHKRAFWHSFITRIEILGEDIKVFF